MRTATLPPLRVEPALRRAIERALREGETISSFVEEAVRQSVSLRETQAAFIARGLNAEKRAEGGEGYVSARSVLAKLGRRLEKARRRAASRARSR